MATKTAIVAIGANLGDREQNLRSAIARLQAKGFEPLCVSSFRETRPVGYKNQPNFLNGAVAFAVPEKISAIDFLRILLDTENALGRERPFPNAPRTCDLDLIFFDDEQISSHTLVLPHPRWRERSFVLDPLEEILSTPAPWNDKIIWQDCLAEIRLIKLSKPVENYSP